MSVHSVILFFLRTYDCYRKELGFDFCFEFLIFIYVAKVFAKPRTSQLFSGFVPLYQILHLSKSEDDRNVIELD
uniref:Uncharacterized protein n=1 Tax=Octopus bimaculoides TaxID=37653 RepID=A0A0L8GJX6_OCTBM